MIDPTTPGTLGLGVYTHPELSWDATKLLFCFKGQPQGSTSIYEIGIDGRGLRRVTDPSPQCDCYKGSHGGQHDIAPAYLPDGRIVFLSTRPSGLVPCANEGVSILHVMNADGRDIHPISVNNVNEFDPAVLPDGRILFGRWEYVDKNALTIQSLWTINPDGTQETALYANNMVFPEAILDARPVPGTHLIVATLAKHNSTPRGSIAFIDPHAGKNDPRDRQPRASRRPDLRPRRFLRALAGDARHGDLQRPAGRPEAERAGDDRPRRPPRGRALRPRDLPALADAHQAPALPGGVPDTIDRKSRVGRFFVQDVYRGLDGVRRGEVKQLRVIEETSRVSPTPGGRQPYNQTFLVSAALAFSVKNYLGVVPVAADGSAYFEVPSGRAVYLQALDADGRLVQSMRTFVQAAPGTTRSCIGCHEYKSARRPRRLLARSADARADAAPARVVGHRLRRLPHPHPARVGQALRELPRGPAGDRRRPGSQRRLDRAFQHQLREPGEPPGNAVGRLLDRGNRLHERHGLLVDAAIPAPGPWVGGCPAGQAAGGGPWRANPGSPAERDLLMAWIDGNGLYHGTWDYTRHGCAIAAWDEIKKSVLSQMKPAGCVRCHAAVENDWINLQTPELSRVLRAPLAKGQDEVGLGLCRDRTVDPKRPRIRLLWNGYAHAVLPLEKFPRQAIVPRNTEGPAVVSFASTADARYRALLDAIRAGRQKALAAPRVDMPGAEILSGECRHFLPPPLPDPLPPLQASADRDGVVHLAWERSARTIGLTAELHRGSRPDFPPSDDTLLTESGLGQWSDAAAPAGRQFYAMVLISGTDRARPVYAGVDVPAPCSPPAPVALQAVGASYSVRLRWQPPDDGLLLSYHVYRSGGNGKPQRITPEPTRETSYADLPGDVGLPHRYVVRSVSRRGIESPESNSAQAAATVVREPVLLVVFDKQVRGRLEDGETLVGHLQPPARAADGLLDLTGGGSARFDHRQQFDLLQPLSLECWVRLDPPGKMPVVVSCGQWETAGWFLQSIAGRWRWHVGGIDCDGGRSAAGRWTHLAGIYDGQGRACSRTAGKWPSARASPPAASGAASCTSASTAARPAPISRFSAALPG